jgi:DNA-binding MarR family transcriptional regulator
MDKSRALEASLSLDDLTFYSLLGIMQSGMWLLSDIEKYLRNFRLSHGRFSILLSLLESPEQALIGNELAVRLGKSKPTITKMIEKLIQEGYIRQASEESDLRKKKYSLSNKARALLDKITPGYAERLNEMALDLSEQEKSTLLGILAKINFLDPRKRIAPGREKSITEKGREIRSLCRRGSPVDIDSVMQCLNSEADLPTTKIVDYYLSTVENIDGIRRIEYYLFNGTQMQRNYCTLYFSRINDWKLVKRAYDLGLIDYIQAFAR